MVKLLISADKRINIKIVLFILNLKIDKRLRRFINYNNAILFV